MKAQIGTYLNEVVSLVILMLMAIALIAGQAAATTSDGYGSLRSQTTGSVTTPHAAAALKTDVDELSFSIELTLKEVTESMVVAEAAELLGNVISIKIDSQK